MKRRTLLRGTALYSGAAALSRSAQMFGLPMASDNNLGAFNQCGYLPGAEKIATLTVDTTADPSFQIISARNETSVFQGSLTRPSTDADSGDHVSLAAFSALTTPGTYRLVTQKLRTEPFVIGADVYLTPLALAMRSFYGQRCGCAVDLGDGYQHRGCHVHNAFHTSSGRSGELDNHGGWHDAGDYGRYIVSSGITTGTLLWAWELYSPFLSNLSLHIPEAGGKLPNYLAEVRWNLEWMLSLQDEDGGVWHKQTSEQFCGMIMPDDDRLTSYVIGTGKSPYKSTCATANLAAAMAIAARCFGKYDLSFSARCLSAAKKACFWVATHPIRSFANPPGIRTGVYGDADCMDEILWATAEIWRTTGEKMYEQSFLELSKELPPEGAIQAPSWNKLTSLAYWTYALADRKREVALQQRILAETEVAAQKLLAQRRLSGYGTTLSTADYIWGSNGLAANQSLLLLLANHFEPSKEKFEAAMGNLHYLLGRNCFGVSWVTQVGSNPLEHPHHRPSVADRLPAPWPGLLSGGPNATPADPVAKSLDKRPPMRMWVDHAAAYSVNEVAINWNAPLVFLLAAANSI